MKNHTSPAPRTQISQPWDEDKEQKRRPTWETVSIGFLIGLGLAFGAGAIVGIDDSPAPVYVEITEGGVTEAQTDSLVVERGQNSSVAEWGQPVEKKGITELKKELARSVGGQTGTPFVSGGTR